MSNKKTGQYFLGGGGDTDISFNFDELYFSRLPTNAKILYIPIALNRKDKGYESCKTWFSSLIHLHDKNNNITFTMLLEDDDIPNVSLYDSIYIGGGNTYILLDFIYQKNLHNIIPDFVNNGGIYYGGSAGAIIVGKSILTAEKKDDTAYLHTEGLNKVNGLLLKPHYLSEQDSNLFNINKQTKDSIIAITEESGLIIDQNNIKVIGTAFMFTNNKKVRFEK